MLQKIAENPLVFLAFIVALILLNIGAAIRVRHDRRLKTRASVNRRQKARDHKDRRWQTRS